MKAVEKVRELFDRWERGEIDKFDFYAATLDHRVSTVAEATGIDPDVIRDRRRYLRQLASDALDAKLAAIAAEAEAAEADQTDRPIPSHVKITRHKNI
jgi:hypothetical protein